MSQEVFESNYEIYKIGDNVQLVFNVPFKEGHPFTHNVKYDGVITKNVPGSYTEVQVTNDNGVKTEVSVSYNSFTSGYESIFLMISENELESRRQEWIQRQINTETKKYNDRIEFLKKIKFKL